MRVGILLLAMIASGSFVRADDVEPAGRPVSYEGRVTGPDAKPVAGAEILVLGVASTGEEAVVKTIKTQDDGRFAIDDLTVSPKRPSHRLLVRAQGLAMAEAPAIWQEENEIRLGPATAVRVVFLGPDGKAVSGLKVRPAMIRGRGPGLGNSISFRDTLAQEMEQQTDANGACTFTDLPRNAFLRLRMNDVRFAQIPYGQEIALGEAGETPAATIHLDGGAGISGKIIYSTLGKPAAGVHVVAKSADPRAMVEGTQAVSDERGEYHLTQMHGGEYNVMINERGDLGRDWTAAVLAKVKLEPGQDLGGQDINLIRGTVIRGKLTKEDTGEGIAGLWVGASETRPSGMLVMERTAADGYFALRIPPGQYNVYMADQPPDGYTGRPRQDVTVVEGKEVTVDFKLPRRPGQPVMGRVLGPDGMPVVGATISAENNKDDMFGGTRQESDDTGTFHFEAITKGTLLRASRGTLETPTTVEVDGGEQDIVLKLAKRIDVKLSGVVTDTEGKPIKGARVQVITQSGRFGLGMGTPEITDEQGRYSIKGLRSSLKYSLSAEADGYGQGNGPVTLEVGKAMAEAQPIQLKPATMRVAGTVVDHGGRPVPKIQVEINSAATGHQTAISDGEGKFSFKVIEEARALVFLRGADGQPKATRDVRAGDDALELVMPDGDLPKK
jgi:hypothetical protein